MQKKIISMYIYTHTKIEWKKKHHESILGFFSMAKNFLFITGL